MNFQTLQGIGTILGAVGAFVSAATILFKWKVLVDFFATKVSLVSQRDDALEVARRADERAESAERRADNWESNCAAQDRRAAGWTRAFAQFNRETEEYLRGLEGMLKAAGIPITQTRPSVPVELSGGQ